MHPIARFLKRYGTVLAALILSAALITACAVHSGRVTDRDSAARWVLRNDPAWRALLSDCSPGTLAGVPEQDSDHPVRRLPGAGEILYIDHAPEADAFRFVFRHLSGPTEGYAALIQAAAPDQAALADPNLALRGAGWVLRVQTAQTRRWESTDGSGCYIQLEEIAPGWYYEEASFPT